MISQSAETVRFASGHITRATSEFVELYPVRQVRIVERNAQRVFEKVELRQT